MPVRQKRRRRRNVPKKSGRFIQGRYKLKNPKKYVGNKTNIRYLSSWELKVHEFLDNNSNILRWSSEELAIPYIKPTDGKVHRYFPDYWVEYKNRQGNLVQEVIEVKPSDQTRPSRRKKSKYKLYENMVYAVNMAKWRAAQEFCNKYGMRFRILTEKDIFR